MRLSFFLQGKRQVLQPTQTPGLLHFLGLFSEEITKVSALWSVCVCVCSFWGVGYFLHSPVGGHLIALLIFSSHGTACGG